MIYSIILCRLRFKILVVVPLFSLTFDELANDFLAHQKGQKLTVLCIHVLQCYCSGV